MNAPTIGAARYIGQRVHRKEDPRLLTGRGQFVEVQGAGEEATFSHEQLQGLLALAQTGLQELAALQAAFLAQHLRPA